MLNRNRVLNPLDNVIKETLDFKKTTEALHRAIMDEKLDVSTHSVLDNCFDNELPFMPRSMEVAAVLLAHGDQGIQLNKFIQDKIMSYIDEYYWDLGKLNSTGMDVFGKILALCKDVNEVKTFIISTDNRLKKLPHLDKTLSIAYENATNELKQLITNEINVKNALLAQKQQPQPHAIESKEQVEADISKTTHKPSTLFHVQVQQPKNKEPSAPAVLRKISF